MSRQVVVYIGTYTEQILFGTGEVYQGKGRGIYRFGLDPGTGRLEPRGLTPDVMNPSYLTLDPRGRFLFAVNELEEFEGQATGTLSAFAVDPADGSLTFLNKQATRGTDPCHVVVDSRGRFALVSNCTSGSLSVLPIGRDGVLGQAVEFAQHNGQGGGRVRQTGPHMHSAGPGWRYKEAPGPVTVAFAVEPGTGKLKCLGHEPTQGRTPRNFAIDPSGGFLLAANQDSDTVVSFRIDPQTGRLRPAGQVLEVPTPVCVLPAVL